MKDNFYSHRAEAINGKEISMSEYRGKVVLVVNTASKCGLTPQYEGLQQLYLKYRDKGLVILGFPCNQFAHQEPGGEKSIQQTCLINYGVTFPMFRKIDVNGKNAHPLFKHLKEELKGLIGSSIKWNFTKFLLNKKGEGVKRFAPQTEPFKLEEYIIKELNL